MALYKIVPLIGGKFAVAVHDGEDHPVISGPYKTSALARAYIAEHQRLARLEQKRTVI